MKFLIAVLTQSLLLTGALRASPVQTPEPVPAQVYKGVSYYVLPELKTVVLENPIRVTTSLVKTSAGYYVGVFGRPDDRIRPEFDEIRKMYPSFSQSFVGILALKKVKVDLGIVQNPQVQFSGQNNYFQAEASLSQADGEKILANFKNGINPIVEVIAESKTPAFTVTDQAEIDYASICQSLKQGALELTVAGSIGSLVGLFSANQIQVRNSSLRRKVVEAILQKCVVLSSQSGFGKTNSWVKAPVQFLSAKGSEIIVLRGLEYLANSRSWNVTVEVSGP
jgi:hypothetical protein